MARTVMAFSKIVLDEGQRPISFCFDKKGIICFKKKEEFPFFPLLFGEKGALSGNIILLGKSLSLLSGKEHDELLEESISLVNRWPIVPKRFKKKDLLEAALPQRPRRIKKEELRKILFHYGFTEDVLKGHSHFSDVAFSLLAAILSEKPILLLESVFDGLEKDEIQRLLPLIQKFAGNHLVLFVGEEKDWPLLENAVSFSDFLREAKEDGGETRWEEPAEGKNGRCFYLRESLALQSLFRGKGFFLWLALLFVCLSASVLSSMVAFQDYSTERERSLEYCQAPSPITLFSKKVDSVFAPEERMPLQKETGVFLSPSGLSASVDLFDSALDHSSKLYMRAKNLLSSSFQSVPLSFLNEEKTGCFCSLMAGKYPEKDDEILLTRSQYGFFECLGYSFGGIEVPSSEMMPEKLLGKTLPWAIWNNDSLFEKGEYRICGILDIGLGEKEDQTIFDYIVHGITQERDEVVSMPTSPSPALTCYVTEKSFNGHLNKNYPQFLLPFYKTVINDKLTSTRVSCQNGSYVFSSSFENGGPVVFYPSFQSISASEIALSFQPYCRSFENRMPDLLDVISVPASFSESGVDEELQGNPYESFRKIDDISIAKLAKKDYSSAFDDRSFDPLSYARKYYGLSEKDECTIKGEDKQAIFALYLDDVWSNYSTSHSSDFAKKEYSFMMANARNLLDYWIKRYPFYLQRADSASFVKAMGGESSLFTVVGFALSDSTGFDHVLSKADFDGLSSNYGNSYGSFFILQLLSQKQAEYIFRQNRRFSISGFSEKEFDSYTFASSGHFDCGLSWIGLIVIACPMWIVSALIFARRFHELESFLFIGSFSKRERHRLLLGALASCAFIVFLLSLAFTLIGTFACNLLFNEVVGLAGVMFPFSGWSFLCVFCSSAFFAILFAFVVFLERKNKEPLFTSSLIS